MELEETGPSQFVVKVREGAPFTMTIGLAAQGGTLSASSATIPAGSITSDPISVTPHGESQVTVTLGAPPNLPVNKFDASDFIGIQIAAGGPLTGGPGSELEVVPRPPSSDLPDALLFQLAEKLSEHIGSGIVEAYSVEEAYKQNKKFLAYFSGSLFEIFGATVYVDLADYFAITVEGGKGRESDSDYDKWVTVWIDVTASKGIGLPFGIGVFELEFEENLPDPKRYQLEVDVVALELGNLKVTVPAQQNSDSAVDFTVRPLSISASVSVASTQKNILRFETRKSILSSVLSSALAGCGVTCSPLILASDIAKSLVERKRSGLPIDLASNRPLRWISASDAGPTGAPPDGQIELVALAGELENPRPR